MFRIGEFSKLSQVSIRMLRYYDKEGLLKPAAIDPATGYRMYSVNQIGDIQKINLLRGMGFSVAETALAVNNWRQDYIIERLEEQKRSLERNIASQRQLIGGIDSTIEEIRGGKLDTTYHVIKKSIPEYDILSLRRIIHDYFCEGQLWMELADLVEREKLMPHVKGNFAMYHDRQYKETDVDVEVAFIMDAPIKQLEGFLCRRSEAVDNMLCIMVLGPYENIGPAYRSFALWLDEHPKYIISGLCRQICHIGPGDADGPSDYVTELQTPVKLKI